MFQELERQQAPSISVVFPAFNDSYVVARQVQKVTRLLPELSRDFEVIVVNDGSQDDTGELLEELRSTEPSLKVIHHEENRGYGGALISGFESASKELVFYTDGDGQYDVRDLAKLMSLLSPAVDAVSGYKIQRSDKWYRVLFGRLYQTVIRALFRLPIRDVDCDFRLIRRSILRQISLKETSGAFCVELVRKLHLQDCRFAEVSVSHFDREYGKSQFFGVRPILNTLGSLVPLWLSLVLLPSLGRNLESGELHPWMKS